jgi:hypothetical protein
MGTLYSGGTTKPTRRDDQISGVVTRLASLSVQVFAITTDSSGNFVSAALEKTVTSDVNGNLADIPVAGAAGALYRLVIADDGQKRCGYWDQLAE